LIDAADEEVILGNSASYGLHLLANGLRWEEGDEVLVLARDFPATILPWLGLAKLGVRVREIRPESKVLQVGDLERAIMPRTRVLAASWVNSFDGHAMDASAIGEACRSNGVLFVLNATQGLGTCRFNVREVPVDAVVSCGFKWLCGPYGTGFCWMRSELLQEIEFNQLYWLSLQNRIGPTALADLGNEHQLPDPSSFTEKMSQDYDVFGTANFLNFMPWTEALVYLRRVGLERIQAHVQDLVSSLIEELDPAHFRIISPEAEGPERSAIVVISHRDPSRNEAICKHLLKDGIHVSMRAGNIRIAPHLYNSGKEMVRVADSVRQAAGI
jgi:selenocysteine lyase/cysteine desulfurase